VQSHNLRIPFNDPKRKFSQDESLASSVAELIADGPYFHGEEEIVFEKALASRLNVANTVFVSSGTSALYLAVASLELPSGSEVILAANAGGYASVAVTANGLIPVYAEIDTDGQLDFDKIGTFKTSNTSAIVVTHLFGQMNLSTLRIKEYCDLNGLKLIEDCSQSITAKFQGITAGSLADISTFSFYPTKNLSSFGDSGAAGTSNPHFYTGLKARREYGWIERYDAEFANGGNFRGDELHALTLNRQLRLLSKQTIRRKKIWEAYKSSISSSDLHLIGSSDESFVAHLAVLKVTDRNAFRAFLRSWGIETSIHYPYPDYRQKAFAKYQIKPLALTEEFASKIVSIPLYAELEDVEVNHICQVLREYQQVSNA
jgi:dTDP-4-amino-4,6-dideoxygalactose transaminase